MNVPQNVEMVHEYPGGVKMAGYRWVFNAFIVIFLGVVCLGLLNFLGIYLKQFWPNL